MHLWARPQTQLSMRCLAKSGAVGTKVSHVIDEMSSVVVILSTDLVKVSNLSRGYMAWRRTIGFSNSDWGLSCWPFRNHKSCVCGGMRVARHLPRELQDLSRARTCHPWVLWHQPTGMLLLELPSQSWITESWLLGQKMTRWSRYSRRAFHVCLTTTILWILYEWLDHFTKSTDDIS